MLTKKLIKIEFLSLRKYWLNKIREININRLINQLILNPQFQKIHLLVHLKIIYTVMEYLTIKAQVL